MRKVRWRFVYKISAVLLFCFVGLLLVFTSPNELDRHTEIVIIERSIRSPMNQGECRLPELPLDNPEIMHFYEKSKKIDCSGSPPDWVMCEKSICFVKPEISSSHGDVICSYTDLIRTSEFKATYGKTTKTKEPYVLRASDFVKVACRAESGHTWYGMAFGIRDGVVVEMVRTPPKTPLNTLLVTEDESSPRQCNVLMFGFDSMSRNAYMRKLPKTYAYLTQELGGVVLKGYNIVGDGTPQALVPLLTGFTELELPDTRRRMRNSVQVDVYPMIWKEYARHGYYTSFNEDLPNVGTFTYRLNGFTQQPVDHYLRTFYTEIPNIWTRDNNFCIGHQPDHVVMLEYTKNFMAKYKESPRFVFSFHGGLSHDSINLIGGADDDVMEWLRSLKAKKLLDDTILIMMADHGNRFAEVRATLQGKQEERLPFFSFVFPKAFRERFPKQYENFVENADRLTTPFDVHATLKHILALQNDEHIDAEQTSETATAAEGQAQVNPPVSSYTAQLARQRARSLFEHIPKNRSCSDAYIEPHWCACLNWQRLTLNGTYGPTLLKMAANIVATINNYTQPYRSLCAPLELDQINWALRLRPHKEMLHFKQSGSADGFMPIMSDKMQLQEELYQLQIVVSPGQSLFEASVSHNLDTFTAHTRLSEISRVNKYGDQAKCIYERDPEMRKYCYCRT